MSGPAAVVLACGLYALCGLGVLALVGMARSPKGLVRMSPVAPLAGIAWVGIAAATAATAGVAFGVVGLVVVTAATCAGGAARLARYADTPTPGFGRRGQRRLELGFAGIGIAVLVSICALAVATYTVKPLVEYDGWAMWAMKAKAIAWLDADPAVLASDTYARLHLEYPLLLPALYALPIDTAERFSSNIVVLQCVAIGLAGLLAIWGLLRGRVRPALLLPFLAAIAAMPAFFHQLGSGYADVPLALLIAAGLVAAARWLVDEGTPWLALATLFLAAAVLTKNEGLLFAAAVLVPLLVVATGRRRAVAASAAVVGLVYVPWRLYIAAYDLGSPGYDLSASFDIPWVVRRLGRTDEAAWGLLTEAVDPRQFGLLLALGVACPLVALLFGHRPLGLLAAGFAVLSLAGLSWIYVISPIEVSSFLGSSANRVVVSALLGLAALCPLLVEECARTLPAREDHSSPRAGSLSAGGSRSPLLRRRTPPQ